MKSDYDRLFHFLIKDEKRNVKVDRDRAKYLMEKHNIRISELDLGEILKEFKS